MDGQGTSWDAPHNSYSPKVSTPKKHLDHHLVEFGIFVFVQVHLSLDGWMVSSELGAVLKTKNLAGFHGASFLMIYIPVCAAQGGGGNFKDIKL